jgi:hypothetical protein
VVGGGPRGHKQIREPRVFFFLFFWEGGPKGHKLRQFVALTQDMAVRGYVALTQYLVGRGSTKAQPRDAGRGDFIFFDLILFFGLGANHPRLAVRLDLYP